MARGVELQHQLSSQDRYERLHAEIEQHVWAYEDARRRGDPAGAGEAWHSYLRTRRSRHITDFWTMSGAHEIVALAAGYDDLDRAARELIELRPLIDTRDVEDDNTNRTISRQYVSMCVEFLSREASIEHPDAAAVEAAMRDIATRIDSVLTGDHHRGFRQIGEIRMLRHSGAAIADTRRSLAALLDDLPPLSPRPWPGQAPELTGPLEWRRLLALADAAVKAARQHDDGGPLDALIGRLDTLAVAPSLAHLLRAHRRLIELDITGALTELDGALRTDDLLRPTVLATRALLAAHLDPATLDDGIADCRTARRVGLTAWRRSGAVDATLARLLLRRAGQPGAALGRRNSDIHEALRLAVRRRRELAGDHLLRLEALTTHDAMTGGGDVERRHRDWRRTVDGPWTSAERTRLATAWAEWAVSTGESELAAQAYDSLVRLVALDSAARHGTTAKRRIVAAAQEYAEEAGYWLARVGRYPEAVVALETGRAIGLTEMLGRPGESDIEHSRGDLVTYSDITAETGDGAIVYIAAARAGGYALVVAATHAPQFVDMPRLDHAAVAAIARSLLPDAAGADRAGGASAPTVERDLGSASTPATSPLANGLDELWSRGLGTLLLQYAHGPIVTLVPVGLLSLLPVHAAGRPADPANPFSRPHHTGDFSAIRYAPNARGLRHCRETLAALAGQPSTLLAVDVPNGSGLPPSHRLSYVVDETEQVTRQWTGRATRPTHECTWEEFRASADTHTVWHLACHGSVRPSEILDSRLYFADRQVTLDELRRTLRPAPRRLAVLSACGTNLTETAVPNEVIGLPSALIEVGFAGVVAAAWRVDDLATAYLMTAFYERWCGHSDPPAVALNHAQRWLRTATRDELAALIPHVRPGGEPGESPYSDPRYWAAFAYTGA